MQNKQLYLILGTIEFLGVIALATWSQQYWLLIFIWFTNQAHKVNKIRD